MSGFNNAKSNLALDNKSHDTSSYLSLIVILLLTFLYSRHWLRIDLILDTFFGTSWRGNSWAGEFIAAIIIALGLLFIFGFLLGFLASKKAQAFISLGAGLCILFFAKNADVYIFLWTSSSYFVGFILGFLISRIKLIKKILDKIKGSKTFFYIAILVIIGASLLLVINSYEYLSSKYALDQESGDATNQEKTGSSGLKSTVNEEKQSSTENSNKSLPLHLFDDGNFFGIGFSENQIYQSNSISEEILNLPTGYFDSSEVTPIGDIEALSFLSHSVLNMIASEDKNYLMFSIEQPRGLVAVYTHNVSKNETVLEFTKEDISEAPYFHDISDDGRYVAFSLLYWFSGNNPKDTIIYDTQTKEERNIGLVQNFEWLEGGEFKYKKCELEGSAPFYYCKDNDDEPYLYGSF